MSEYFHSRMEVAVGCALAAPKREGGYRTFTAVRAPVSAEPRYRIPERPDPVIELPAGIQPVRIIDPYWRTPLEAEREGARASVDFAPLFAGLDEPAE